MEMTTYYHPSYGRMMTKQGHALSIYWSTDKIDYLRRHYPTTVNDELAGCLGVSKRTMIRMARKLGLAKDGSWLKEVRSQNLFVAGVVNRAAGYPGAFKKGHRANPAGEFKKGRKVSAEARARISKQIKEWYRTHPNEAKDKARRACETRSRKNDNENG